MIDTHSHLYLGKFDGDRAAVHDRARNVLSHVFLPNIDLESLPKMNALADADPGFFYPMLGLHPCYIKENYPEVLDRLEAEWESGRRYYGVGETGLDYYWDTTFAAGQKDSLRRHIAWAKAKDLPLILHCRESMDDVIALVSEGQDGRLKGIFHCFNGSAQQAAQIQDLGFLMGIGGVLTYKNSGVAEVVAGIGLAHLVLETDSPYLPPVPHRGKRNESSYTALVARKLAEVKGTTVGEIDRVTTANARQLFGVVEQAAPNG
ncbi:MAG: TatD family hydrolase [Bacteroidota bacterium]